MSQTLESALTRSRRSSFVKHYLLVLWPYSERILLEMARRLGDEIALPGDPCSLLANCMTEGAENFYRKKGRYNSSTWDKDIFLHFYQAAFARAAAIFDCEVRPQNGNCWDVTRQPYLDWRLENPGPIEVTWKPPASPAADAGHLFDLVFSACQYPRNWMVEQLLLEVGDGRGKK